MKRYFLGMVALFVSSLAFAVVNINTATQAELESLKGIGPEKAKAIIEYRTKNGAFKTVDDLDKVKGIGKATLDKLRPDISVGGAAAKPAPAAAKPADKKAPEPKKQ